MAGCQAVVQEVTKTLPAVQSTLLHHKLLGASKVRHTQCATCLKAAVSSAQHSRVRLAARKLICCTEVPSCTHEQRLSPDTASSHVAPADESAARVRCRAQWRQQSQAPALPSLTECGCTLRAISIGKPVAAEALLYANAVLHQPKCHVQHHNMVKLASTVHQCHQTALGQPYPVAAPQSTCSQV